MAPPSQTSSPGELFKAGQLNAAIEAANALVRGNPADPGPRVWLAELLLFSGNLERADKLLDAASQIDPQTAIAVAEFRQLIRAEQARQQFRTEGRVPELLADPNEVIAALLGANVAVRNGKFAEAAEHAAQAEQARPAIAGTHDGTAFDDLRDASDLTAGVFEILTTTGKFFWISAETVEAIAFEAPERPRDLFWRRAQVSVRGGPDGVVYFPALYGGEGTEAEPSLALGRATDWREKDGLVYGVGQRLFLVGEEAIAIGDLHTLDFGEE